jgi:seryl-tRNA synthetase
MPKPEDNVQVVKLPEEPKVDELASISNQLEAENTKLNESKKELKEQINQVKSTDETGSSALKDRMAKLNARTKATGDASDAAPKASSRATKDAAVPTFKVPKLKK